MFFEDFLTFLSAWYRSRKWRTTLWLVAATAVLPLLAAILILVGSLRSRGDMLADYMQLVTNQLDLEIDATGGQGLASATAGTAAAAKVDAVEVDKPELTEEQLQEAREQVQVPLRRMMQLGSSNERVVYAVASQLLRQGRVGMATRLLRDIAPEGGQGFAAAHAWLARLRQLRSQASDGSVRFDDVMQNDLAVAEAGGGLQKVEIANYARFLARMSRGDEALRLLRRNANIHPELDQVRAIVAKELEDTREFRDAASSYEAYLEQRMRNQPTLEDYAGSVVISQLRGDYEAALKNTVLGQQAFPENGVFRRLRASVYVEMYQNSKQANAEDPLAGLEYLDQAMRLDPSNASAMTAVNELIGSGKPLPPTLIRRLEIAVVDGEARALAHAMLANVKLMNDDAKAAIPHLRLALEKSTPSPILLNNLAIAMLEAEPENVAEAKQYAEQALELGTQSPQVYASIWDTLGQIQVLEDDTLAAIGSFERAIQADKTKLNTRRRLASAYRQAGMNDLADLQLARVKQLEAQ